MLPRAFQADDGKDFSPKLQSRFFISSLMKYFLPFFLLASAASFFGYRYFDSPKMVVRTSSSVVFSCVNKELSVFDRWVKPTSSLMHHNMSDEELFWAVSFASSHVKECMFNRVPKVAFMFLTRGPLPLSPLWERFFKGNEGFYSIYVHSLPSYKANFSLESVFYNRQIPSQVTEWGKISMCDAERRLLANALLDLSNEWFILLSESCIPLYNFSIIYTHLKESNYSFVDSFDDPSPHARGRYIPQMAPLINITQWRKGSQWFEVDRKAATPMVQDTKYYSAFKEFCKPPCYVDEHYFPTLLHIETSSLIANRTITFTDWSRGGSHPATYGEADISEEFFKKILDGQDCLYNGHRSSICVLFARKFAPSALQPLLHLASSVLGFS